MTETKTFGIVDVDIKAPTDDTNPNGSFEAILSAPTVDRDGEVIDPKAFEPLPDHITIDVDHGMSVATTVGSGTPFYEGDVLKFIGTFSSIPRAQEVRTLVTEGHIRKMSVAFMNANRETDPDDERPHIRRAELLNAAIVPIPSNREASITGAKDAKVGARNSEKDAARLQSIHDLAVANGAGCKHAEGEPKSAFAAGGAVLGPQTFIFAGDSTGEPWVVKTSSSGTETSTDTDPEQAAAPAAADAPAEVAVDPKAYAALAEAEALLA
jgi:HK97 family phage prohead protease